MAKKRLMRVSKVNSLTKVEFMTQEINVTHI